MVALEDVLVLEVKHNKKCITTGCQAQVIRFGVQTHFVPTTDHPSNAMTRVDVLGFRGHRDQRSTEFYRRATTATHANTAVLWVC